MALVVNACRYTVPPSMKPRAADEAGVWTQVATCILHSVSSRSNIALDAENRWSITKARANIGQSSLRKADDFLWKSAVGAQIIKLLYFSDFNQQLSPFSLSPLTSIPLFLRSVTCLLARSKPRTVVGSVEQAAASGQAWRPSGWRPSSRWNRLVSTRTADKIGKLHCRGGSLCLFF